MSVNKAILIGRLGRDPEVRYTNQGSQVTTFSLATDEAWTDRNGERQKRTEWHRVVTWGKLAEICGQYLKKGSQVFVEGKLQTREWEDRDGNKRYTTEVVAREMKMLDSKGAGDSRMEEPPPPDEPFAAGGGEEDDIPF
ncbi:MAG: single-stranded DNA-binding protein [Deltaproteobacteria bacterium]|nr:single-stranded DNA-binding protein [Deltaproteobacteria bacterium]